MYYFRSYITARIKKKRASSSAAAATIADRTDTILSELVYKNPNLILFWADL